LVYEVLDKEICVLVIGIGKREGGRVYQVAKFR
jgi:mRNA-degrading endonuclease RelE of RelBE toxin-antitoxin system